MLYMLTSHLDPSDCVLNVLNCYVWNNYKDICKYLFHSREQKIWKICSVDANWYTDTVPIRIEDIRRGLDPKTCRRLWKKEAKCMLVKGFVWDNISV